MNREELAWAAGFFDGEAHIGCVHTGKKGSHLHIQICQTEDGPLERFQRIIGGVIYGPYNHNQKAGMNRRLYKQLHIDKFENVQHAVCLLWPWLSAPKRQQAKAALTAYRDRPLAIRGRPRKAVNHV